MSKEEAHYQNLYQELSNEKNLSLLLKEMENEINFSKEVLEQKKIEGLLKAFYHPDPKGTLISENLACAQQNLTKGLSSRIMKKIDQKQNQKRWFKKLLLAALILISSSLIYLFLQPKNSPFEGSLAMPGYSPVAIKNHHSYENISFQPAPLQTNNQDNILLSPHAKIKIDNNILHLQEGQLTASIQKRKNAPLYFNTPNTSTQIIGTQFEMQTVKQNNEESFTFYLTEGSVAFSYSEGKQLLEPGDFLYYRPSEKKYTLKKETSPQNKNQIYHVDKQQKWIPLFWKNWPQNQVKQQNGSLILTSTNAKKSYIISQPVFTEYQPITYEMKMLLSIPEGKTKFGLKCYHEDSFNYEDAFILEKEKGKITISTYQMRKGLVTEKRETIINDNQLTNFTLEGKISHHFTDYQKDLLKDHQIKEIMNDNSAKIKINTTELIRYFTIELFIETEKPLPAELKITNINILKKE